MIPVLVLVDHADEAPRSAALELLTAARALGPVHAAWLGDGAQGALAALGDHGVVVVHEAPEAVLPGAVAATLAALAASVGAPTVLLTSTFANKEVAAHLAHTMGAGLVVDASGVSLEGGRVVTVQEAFEATWTVRARVGVERAVVTVKANAVPASPVAAPTTPQLASRTEVAAGDGRVRVVERVPRESSGRPDLGEASVVVVGGRGTEGDFSPVFELADALGGAVGATRDVTDEGWIGHESMVGQTGTTIAPRLYVGAGVSGAVHHRGGMQASGVVVAVNSDPDAPIFEFADFGVVGDLFAVLPQAAEEIRRLKG